MSKSRLEKFLYALYSLDSSDLPTPLSRIEELYNCWVTGEEAPTFEPLSRVEKYLMAILGGYDVDSLPNPLSRVEVLLYKLATGDDNLDDVKTFLSEHEELLAEIIRNGGVGGNIDIEYVLYTLSTKFNTLYNTAEKPVKSAILKGNTKYRDIDTGDILDTFDETKNLELVSVKLPVLTTTGKNLFDGIMTRGQLQNNNLINNNQTKMGYSEFLHIEEELDIYCSYYTNSTYVIEKIYFYDENKNQISSKNTPTKVTSPKGAKYFRLSITTTNWYSNVVFDDIKDDFNIQVETGIQATSYEPYKSNILTVNEEVVLRGVGDVKDELNLLTGELTQRIGKVVLDGSESWIEDTNGAGVRRYFVGGVGGDLSVDVSNSSSLLCDKFKASSNTWIETNDGVQIIKSTGIYFIDSSVDSLDMFVNKLKTTNIKVQYSLIEKPVKTVDLSTVNQDGNNTKLSTFDDITHVTLSSEGLIPEAELGVATKNEEVLSTMSLEMNDISTTQNALQETSDIQSENVDATMIATTEIYEGLL